MVFDNGKIVLKLNIRRYLSLLAYLAVIVVLVTSGLFEKPVLGISKTVYIISATSVYILYIVYAYFMNYNFFSFNDEGDKLVFRFVSLRPFDNEKRAIEIPKRDFIGFKIEKSFFNLKRDLIITIRTNKGIAKYPSISISALSEEQMNLLSHSLSQFS